MENYFELMLLSEDQGLRACYKRVAAQSGKEDSGCDLFAREAVKVPPGKTARVRFGVACRVRHGTAAQSFPVRAGYWLLPRSSFGKKTPLVMANSVGLIDAGYRGELMAYVRNVSNRSFRINQYESWFQLALPSLLPADCRLVEQLDSTARGAGGFGSTGNQIASSTVMTLGEAKERSCGP